MSAIVISMLAAAAAHQTAPVRAQIPPRPLSEAARIEAPPPPADTTLRGLLASGYEIIHVEAPVGAQSARFILRKGADIFSCEPVPFRSGNDNSVRIISQPCLNLTPPN